MNPYEFIFIFIYKFLKRVGADDVRDGAVTFSVFVMISNLLFVLVFLRHLELFDFSQSFNHDSSRSKYYYAPLIIGLMILCYVYLNKNRVSKIIKKYENASVLTIINSLFFIVIAILPLIFLIYLL